jgi:YesN/AraC family two-component response regulator
MAVKILLVDDNAVVRRALRCSIESQTDWEVAGEAENGKVAIELVQRSSPDVIILDLSMPVMNGLDAARHISKPCRPRLAFCSSPYTRPHN